MDSIANLQESLPNANLVSAEKDLLNNFKAAALSITTLYKSSLKTSKRSYSAGYEACLTDVLHFIQAGVSVDVDNGGGMTIGRIMDWVEGRLDALKAEEEDEEEEREREARAKSGSRRTATAAAPSSDSAARDQRKQPQQPPQQQAQAQPHQQPPPQQQLRHASPTPPSSPSFVPIPIPSTSTPARTAKYPARQVRFDPPTASSPASSTHQSIDIDAPEQTLFSIPNLGIHALHEIPMGIGMKRRHAAMSMSPADAPSPSGPSSSASHGPVTRRRARKGGNSLSSAGGVPNTTAAGMEDMDVEDERERKRPARR